MADVSGNESQIKAIMHGTGPMIVLAGPGSGKTFVITRRIEYLIRHHHVNPSKILVITFTKAAAMEMKERFQKLFQGFAPVWFGTFHAVFYNILKQVFHYGLGSIITEQEKKNLLIDIIHKEKLEIQTSQETLELLLSEISKIKNSNMNINHFESSVIDTECFRVLYKSYGNFLDTKGQVDFDDMVLKCRQLLLERPEILRKWQMAFEYILIDEFQDINPLQYEVIRLLSKPENNLFIVGDDDQSIYGFRGANPKIMLGFEQDFPTAKRVLLNINYRSSGSIVKKSCDLIRQNGNRFDKKVYASKPIGSDVIIAAHKTREEAMEYLLSKLKKKQNEKKLSQCAIIMRTSGSFSMLSQLLCQNQIPFHSKEKIKSVFEHFIMRDICTYLEIAAGDQSRNSFFKIMNRPLRYISRDAVNNPISFEKMKYYYAEKPYMQDTILRLENDIFRISKMPLFLAINYIRKGMGYDLYLQESVQYNANKVEELFLIADTIMYSAKNMKSLIQWKNFIEEQKKLLIQQQRMLENRENIDEMDRVTLITMHGSKGLEFETVYMIDCNEGITPHRKAKTIEEIEEERRMFYVGMTRAKEELVLQYITGTKDKPLFPSRFITCN